MSGCLDGGWQMCMPFAVWRRSQEGRRWLFLFSLNRSEREDLIHYLSFVSGRLENFIVFREGEGED